MTSNKQVMTNWKSNIDGITQYYILERAIDKGSYKEIRKITAMKTYGQQYYYADAPGSFAPRTPIHYRLTPVLVDSSRVTPSERTIEWIDGSRILDVYPNPTQDGAFTIHWNADPGTVMQVSTTDMMGKTIDEASVTATQWDNTVMLQTGRRPTGVYIIRIIINGYRYTTKMVYE
jgi:hypothetical protein